MCKLLRTGKKQSEFPVRYIISIFAIKIKVSLLKRDFRYKTLKFAIKLRFSL